ncbi:hypothetical protein ABZ915_22295 [Streptomyces sp. NPDC046915]|uniref:hypothetical protein n=1 Tax=Streptomyces sp. NPDC046915 TaxID=3155257 RepID=UPI0033EEE185
MSGRRWATGVGAVVVLAATGTWAMRPADVGTRPSAADVDTRLWSQVRPVIEARLVAEAHGSGYGEAVPALDARWFCRAEPIGLEEHGDAVRAGVDTLCVEYGMHGRTLVECSAGQVPQVVSLARDTDGGYRVVSREEAPDGAGNGRWTRKHLGVFASSLVDSMPSDALEAAARTHFGLAADAPVGDC